MPGHKPNLPRNPYRPGQTVALTKETCARLNLPAKSSGVVLSSAVTDRISYTVNVEGKVYTLHTPDIKPPVEKRLPKILAPADATRLINAPFTHYRTRPVTRGESVRVDNTLIRWQQHMIMLLMYHCGLREEEVCNLTVGDVNLSTRLVTVQRGKGRKDRVVPLQKADVEPIKQWLSVREGWLREKRVTSTWFVCTGKGTPICASYIRRFVAGYSRDLGIYLQDREKKQAVHPHVLRHCYATYTYNARPDLRKLQELLGHASSKTTEIYTHVSVADLQELVDGLPEDTFTGAK